MELKPTCDEEEAISEQIFAIIYQYMMRERMFHRRPEYLNRHIELKAVCDENGCRKHHLHRSIQPEHVHKTLPLGLEIFQKFNISGNFRKY